ncbi:anti-sigma factor [Spirosoma sp. BT702]|uniref:Regulator of SigK n=1 Tax=Spirosoma profusum TaxID=2771354 RepID=A0A927AR58_9BACT|nr:anti-sigma factor [Spirosoma profusum]MBD2701833.1 anti-sigma factor [Spirosoma profusum]
MNVTEYIESGILESYVMGAVSDQERREVQCLSSIYPEIKAELDQLSEAFEQYALAYSVEPPVSIKTKLLNELDFNEQSEETVVRPLPVDRPFISSFRATWIVAASVGLFLLLFSLFLLSELRTNQKTLASMRESNTKLQGDIQELREEQSQNDQMLALLRQPGTRTIALRGNEKAPDGNMLVFWNRQTHEVAIQVQSLPTLPPDKQYQLWSLVGGKPVDAGVFDPTNGNQLLQRLNRSITQADAFAVTVEKRGGSPSPTLTTLLAMTPVNS